MVHAYIVSYKKRKKTHFSVVYVHEQLTIIFSVSRTRNITFLLSYQFTCLLRSTLTLKTRSFNL